MKISKYPLFTPISIDIRSEFITHTSSFDSFSDFNFTSLLAWGGASNAECSLLNNNLIIRLPDYLLGHHIYSVLGTHKLDETLDALLNKAHILKLIPQAVIDSIEDPSAYTIKEDRSNFDYIYTIKNLTQLEGSANKKYRQKIHSFEVAHVGKNIEVLQFAHLSIQAIELIQEINKKWNEQTQRQDDEVRPENNAINRLLLHANELDLITVIILVDGKPIAFSINEMLTKNDAICHFEKALVDHHSSTATYMVYTAAKALENVGCKMVNWEQDLGLEGLRRSKEFYNPSAMLKKYEITPIKAPIYTSRNSNRHKPASHVLR